MSRGTLVFLLQHLVFVINLKKSVLKHPSQKREFLGVKIDTHTMTLALTEKKIEKVILKCQNLLSHPQTTVLELTKLIGLMSSTLKNSSDTDRCINPDDKTSRSIHLKMGVHAPRGSCTLAGPFGVAFAVGGLQCLRGVCSAFGALRCLQWLSGSLDVRLWTGYAG